LFAQGDDDDNSSYNDSYNDGLVEAPHYFFDNFDTDDSDSEIDEDKNVVGVDLNVQGDAPNHYVIGPPAENNNSTAIINKVIAKTKLRERYQSAQQSLNSSRKIYFPISATQGEALGNKYFLIVQNFAPDYLPAYYLTSSKWTRRPNQSSYSRVFLILGRLMLFYCPELGNIVAAVEAVSRSTFLSNRTYLGGAKTWASSETERKSYETACVVTDPINKDFHEQLCESIEEEGGDYRVMILGKDPYINCKGWFDHSKIVNNDGWLVHGSYLGRNSHDAVQRKALVKSMNAAVAFITGKELLPVDDSVLDDYLNIGRQSKRSRRRE
jgi:hypothetical protein